MPCTSLGPGRSHPASFPAAVSESTGTRLLRLARPAAAAENGAMAIAVAPRAIRVASLLLVGLVAGCGGGRGTVPGRSASPSTARAAGRSTTTSVGRTTTTVSTTTTTTAPTTTTTAAPTTTTTIRPKDGPGWTIVSENRTNVVTDERTIALPDGDRVTLVRWHAGTYRVDLHYGSEDPPTDGRAIPAVAGAAIAASERPALLGAFNGGFETATGAGGFEADGQVAVPLVAGDASAVIDQNGAVRVGNWGQTVPVPGEKVVSVRQNLQLLLDNGVPSPAVGDVPAWGATLGGGAIVARSAVGVDIYGNLVYAGSMGAVPSDLATAMRLVGVANAMELDINPEWVQADTAPSPGGPLSPAIPGQYRPADQYLVGWTRDFFAVLAAPGQG